MGGLFVRPQHSGCSPALADARELLAPPGSAASEGLEAELETVSEPSKRCGAQRLCCCAVVAAAAAACLAALCLAPGSSPEAVDALLRSPGFEGVVPADSRFFLHHIGGICFGRKRVETDSVVGKLVVELSVAGMAPPWRGRGELYVMVFDDEPRHWGMARGMWQVAFSSRLADASNFCALATQLQDFGGQSSGRVADPKDATVYVNLRIQEKVTRMWRVALLGVDWQPEARLAHNITYRVRGESGLLGWSGGKTSGPAKCPPQNWEALKERVWDFLMPEGTSALPTPLKPQPMIMHTSVRGLARCARAS